MQTGCDDRPTPSYADHQLRVVSMAPSITQVVIELGLQDAIVGVGEYDDLAPPNTPSLGRFVDLDLERLVTLAPTHVLAVTGEAGLPLRVNEMAEQGYFELVGMPYPNDIDSLLSTTDQIGAALGRASAAQALSETVSRRLEAMAEMTEGRERPRVLMVFETEPLWALGPGTVSDALLQIAGGRNAAAQATVEAPVYDREALRALAPEVVFLFQPGGEPLVGPDDARLSVFRGLDLPAMRDQRVYLFNDPAALLPAPSVMTTAASMTVALHPDLDEQVAEVFRAIP